MYLVDNIFNEQKACNNWNGITKQAVDEGYDGVRAVADTSWLEKNNYRPFLQFEQVVNNWIVNIKLIVICLYDVHKINPYEVAYIIKSHGYVITWYDDHPELIQNMELLLKEKELRESRQLLERALEYDRMKTEFLSNITHELKTPISVILSAIQVLLKIKEGSGQQTLSSNKYFKSIQQNCLRLLRLVNNLLDITRIDSNYFEINLENYDIVDLIGNITLSVNEYAKSKGISISFETDVRKKIIACDPDQMERIILNLLSNAIKFTPRGGNIHVTVMDGASNIKVIVKDSGIGIPADKQEFIFKRFCQVDSSRRRSCEGSGIGLSLVKALIEKHNGNITLKSAPGQGSEFILEIPCHVVQEKPNQKLSQYELTSRNVVERIKVEFSDIYI